MISVILWEMYYQYLGHKSLPTTLIIHESDHDQVSLTPLRIDRLLRLAILYERLCDMLNVLA
jgi:hypothetical protein